MIRKLIFVVGGVLLLGVVFCGRNAISYISTSAGYVRDSIQDSVPIEFEIERARGMIKDLVPEVRKNMHVIAKEEVEIKRLEEQIAKAGARLAKEKSGLTRLGADLDAGKEVYEYGGRTYTAQRVKADLASRFERYKTGEATLGSLREIHAARQRSLEAARRKLEGMLVSKRQLQVDVENLEARTQMIAAAKTTSDYQFDDSRLGRVKELICNLRTRLDVACRLVDAQEHFRDEIPLDREAPENIVDQVTEYFSDQAPAVEAIAGN